MPSCSPSPIQSLLFAFAVAAATLGAPALAGAESRASADSRSRGTKSKVAKTKRQGKTTREKALLNVFDQAAPAMPSATTDVERKELVVAPKISPKLLRKSAPPATAHPSQLTASGELLTAQTAPPPPPVEEAPKAAAAPVAAAPAAPRPDPRRPQVTAEDASKIDSIVSKAFVAGAAAPGAKADVVVPPSSELAPDKIAAAMKPISKEVKRECLFGERGVVVLRFEVDGAGRIERVTPEGPLATRPEVGCVVDAAKKARLVGASLTSFRYPFPVK